MTFLKIFRPHNFFLLRRLISTRTKIIFLILLSSLILFINAIVIPWMKTPDMTMRKECPAEVNRKSKIFAERKVHILSSKPDVGRLESLHEKRQKIECVNMSLPDHSKKYKICLYYPNHDLIISKSIKRRGKWQGKLVAEMYRAFQMFPKLILVDLGSNIGTFTLPAAVTGAEVIAVDPLKHNHQLLQHSITENNLSCQVTLVQNAIYNRRGPMTININLRNIGGSFLNGTHVMNVKKSKTIDAVCLDDLIPMVDGKTVFLKMDIEGSEAAAFECADQFFKHAKVKVLLVEWTFFLQNEKLASNIIKFLQSHNMVPTSGVDRNSVIDISATNRWPNDVFWMEE